MWDERMPVEYRNAILTGDARVLSARIPDESVDLCFCDPIYDRIEDYAWLAETAARVLKPGGAAFVAYGLGYLPQAAAALSRHLRYRWDFTVFMPNAPSNRGAYRVFCKQWRVMLLDCGGFSFIDHVPDVYASNGAAAVAWAGSFKANGHQWVKNPEPYIAWIDAATKEGAVVFDPFTGGGTVPAVCKMLNRNYIAMEIDPATAERARTRVAQTQAMHPVLLGVQEPLALEEVA